MTPRAWRLLVPGPALRGLDRLPEKAASAVAETLVAIRQDPYRVGRPLRFELEGQYVARRGPYRVLYTIDDRARAVAIVAIGHRAEIYRRR